MTARRTAVVLIGAEIGLAALFGVTGALHGFHGTAYAETTSGPLPVCQYEDGNVDGQPCEWTDPDTGNRFYVDSSNYRELPMV